eukprot:CAMPEP_0195639484 /NCGR_PEP_ID=MMETSP0815-20121206/25609_1 /TAXON_ID=97485 /ORGANISM="Prymnesium parvum, Strain Texoma1" /LENGTH=192 /DNA_ID=CAMNT_0040782027 /DNA_START=256 /DNA_END=834 /DNA_ORIENTATION=-
MVLASSFTQVAPNRWSIHLESPRPINEIAAFVTEPLAPGMALGCHVASAPFEQASWHYLGAISAAEPSVVFKTRFVWSARDAVPTTVQFGVELQPASQLLQAPAEKVSVEVLEAGRRIGQDLYQYLASFAVTSMTPAGEVIQLPAHALEKWLARLRAAGEVIQLPAHALEKWLARFNSKCRGEGLDWLNSTG